MVISMQLWFCNAAKKNKEEILTKPLRDTTRQRRHTVSKLYELHDLKDLKNIVSHTSYNSYVSLIVLVILLQIITVIKY